MEQTRQEIEEKFDIKKWSEQVTPLRIHFDYTNVTDVFGSNAAWCKSSTVFGTSTV